MKFFQGAKGQDWMIYLKDDQRMSQMVCFDHNDLSLKTVNVLTDDLSEGL